MFDQRPPCLPDHELGALSYHMRRQKPLWRKGTTVGVDERLGAVGAERQTPFMAEGALRRRTAAKTESARWRRRLDRTRGAIKLDQSAVGH